MSANVLRGLLPVLALVFFFAQSGLHAESSPRLLQAQPGPLAALIPVLERASPEARFEFARLVVEALVQAHEAELDRASLERPRTVSGQQRLVRWRGATANFLADLRVAQANLYGARSVEVQSDRQGQLLLIVDGRALWVTWPRVDRQVVQERDVAAAFCREHPCVSPAGARVARSESESSAAGSWILSQGRSPAWVSRDGVRCEFQSLADRSQKESVCRAVAVDLRTLATALLHVVEAGEPVQWERLMIHAEPGGFQHRITVNEHGDFLQVPVPALAENPVDWGALGHWLKARAAGQAATVTVLRLVPR